MPRDPAITSKIMSAVRSRDTTAELRLRAALFAAGCRYRVHYGRVTGRPDVAFPGKRLAVFVDGDYWHGNVGAARGFASSAAEPYEPYGRWAHSDFWKRKISQNVERDRRVDRELGELGWAVVRIWESQLIADLDTCVRRVLQALGRSA